jgi:DNA-binding CsgD family transcriptional regulator
VRWHRSWAFAYDSLPHDLVDLGAGGAVITGASLPLVGRTALLGRLHGQLRTGTSVLLQGAAGVGKTRLAWELSRDPSARDADRVLASPATAELALSTLAPLTTPAVTSAELDHVHAWFFAHWRERCVDGRAALVWLDDAQHVDALSAALLRRAVTAGIVQLLATHRTPEPLPADLHALLTEGLLAATEVPPLAQADAARLAEAAAPTPLTAAQLDRVIELSQGNPLYVRELAMLVTAADRDMAWRNLRGVVGRPIDRLTPSLRRTIELIAVAEPVPAALFASRSDDVAVLLRAGLVHRQGRDALRVDHPLRAAWITHQLGPLDADVHRELVELADSEGVTDQLDPFTVVEWHLRGGIRPDQDRALAAARLAIARSDGATAQRMVRAVDGPQRALLEAQARVISGDVDGGLAALDHIRRSGPTAERVEAAALQARYVGVMLGDFERAHELLASIHDGDLSPRLRGFIGIAQLWLWIFGPVPRPEQVDSMLSVAADGPADRSAHQILVVGLALLCHTVSPVHIDQLVADIEELEHRIDVGGAARAQARAATGWYHLARGDAGVGAELCRAALDAAVRDGNAEGTALLGGSGALIMALHGRVTEARRMGAAAIAMPDAKDWFNYRHLALLMDLGNRCYVGRGADVPGALTALKASSSAGHRFDLHAALLERASWLSREVRGGTGDAALLCAALEQLAEHNKSLWVALFASELVDVRSNAALLELVRATAAAVPSPGFAALVAQLFGARLQEDADGIYRAGVDLEWSGLPIAASRAMADVVRLDPDADVAARARRALVRHTGAWDGTHMWWTDDLPGMPTPRQIEIARCAVDGRSADDIATLLTLSRRTVENHLYRIGRVLQVSGRDELVAALTPPERPPGWLPGLTPDS